MLAQTHKRNWIQYWRAFCGQMSWQGGWITYMPWFVHTATTHTARGRMVLTTFNLSRKAAEAPCASTCTSGTGANRIRSSSRNLYSDDSPSSTHNLYKEKHPMHPRFAQRYTEVFPVFRYRKSRCLAERKFCTKQTRPARSCESRKGVEGNSEMSFRPPTPPQGVAE